MSVDALALTDLDSKLGGPGVETGRARPRVRIRDRRFLKSVRKLRLVRSFEISGGAQPDTELSESLGSLSQLHYALWGRLPTKQEWAEVDRLTAVLFSQLSEPLKKKFARSAVSPFIAYLPVLLLITACISFITITGKLADAQWHIINERYYQSPDFEKISKLPTENLRSAAKNKYFVDNAGASTIGVKELLMFTNFAGDANDIIFSYGVIDLLYIIWIVSMGCMGAVAFIGMNAISAQDDITFDLSNMRLMILRVVLGGLFALVLTLPFGSERFISFCYIIGTGAKSDSESGGNTLAQILMLTMPFLLGFSTSLVILILNQLVESVQAFFGRRPGAAHGLELTGPQQPGRTAETGSASSSAAMLPPPSIASS